MSSVKDVDNVYLQFFVVVIAVALGIVIGAAITHLERTRLWEEHARNACHPFALDHVDYRSFYFSCAEPENDL